MAYNHAALPGASANLFFNVGRLFPVMPSGTPSMAKQIGEMGRLAGDVKSLLGSQKDVLSRAGLNFPPGVMDSLAGLRDTLERLSPQLASLEAENAQLRALADTSSVINSSLDLNSVLN